MQKKKGISLIVLVITIIVMIVLAGAIILSLNNSGIIKKASEAVDKTNEANVREFAQTKWAEAYLNTDKTQEELEEYVLAELTEAGIDTNEYSIKVTMQGVTVIKSVIATVDGVPIPKGFVASQATGENVKEDGLVIYEGSEYVTDANVETARRTRNQYVWVPVDKATFDETFVRNDYINDTSLVVDADRKYYALGTSSKYWEVIPTTELNESNLQYMTKETLIEVQDMYASVKKYGGFYIARYEAGIDSHRTKNNNVIEKSVYSMMNKIPYINVPWTKNNKINEDTGGAVEISRSIYPETNMNYGVVSTLVYGVQWDTTLQWWINSNAVESITESVDYGNYSNSVINTADELNEGALVWDYSSNSNGSFVAKDSDSLVYPKSNSENWGLSTGALKLAKVNNIYDMAGNFWEWTMEGHSSVRHVRRGGYFGRNGNLSSVSFRGNLGVHVGYYDGTFRLALYVK